MKNTKHKVNKRNSASLSVMAFILMAKMSFSGSAVAETSSPLALEEIVVSARRIEENLQSTPVAITALSGESLQSMGVDNVISLDTSIPNVSIGGGLTSGANIAVFSIRGISEAQGSVSTEPAVGIYIDDVYYPRAHGALLDVVDVERIEVLRGPQGTLFGKNTAGGAVRYVTKKPDFERSLKFSGAFGNRGARDVSIIANLPLTEEVAARLTLASKEKDGYVKRVIDGAEQGDVDVLVVRGQLRFEPSSAWDINVAMDWTDSEDNGPARDITQIFSNGLFPRVLHDLAFNSSLLTSDPYTVYGGTLRDQTTYESFGISLTAQYELSENLSVRSVTAYRDAEMFSRRDWDMSPSEVFRLVEDFDLEYFSQEIQMNGLAVRERLKWVAGVFYFTEDSVQDRLRAHPLFPGLEPEIRDQETTSYAIFAQGSYALTDKLSGTLGLRYSQDNKDFTGVRGTASGKNDDSWDDVSPRFSIEYQLNEDQMVYGSVAKGFRAGSFNDRPRPGAPNNGIFPYDPEELWTYELGWRSDLLGQRLRLNATAFYTDYQDLQVQSILVINGNVYPTIQNVGEASVKGFELEITALLTDGLLLRGSYGALDAEYDDITGATGLTLDSEFARAPEHSYSIGATYTLKLDQGAQLITNIDWGWKDNQQSNSTPSNSLYIKDYGLLSAQITYRPEETSRWNLSLYGANLTDENYAVGGFDEPVIGVTQVDRGRRREYGLRLALEL